MSALHNLARANNHVLLEKILNNFYKQSTKKKEESGLSKDAKDGTSAKNEPASKEESQSVEDQQSLPKEAKEGEVESTNDLKHSETGSEGAKAVEGSNVIENKTENTSKDQDGKGARESYRLSPSFIDKRDDFKRTPLHLACYEGHLEIVKLLLKYGADVNAQAKHGMTSLHFATQKGHLDVVKTLCKHGSKVNTQTNNCMTPLHFAMASENVDCVLFLISKGAVQKYNKKGELPTDLASEGVLMALREELKEKFDSFEKDVPGKRKVHKETVQFYKKRK